MLPTTQLTLSTLALSSGLAGLVLSGGMAQAEALTAFDVAEDHTRIFMAAQPVHENGMPAHGNAFVSQGYIYPEGTLADQTAGVLEDGSPAFPDLVLGTWTCDGYFVGDGGNTTTGVWIISRQTFAFNDGATIVTQGTEIADIGQPNLRPVTGATGDYAMIDRGLVQTTLGFTDFWGLSATFAFEAPIPGAQDAAFGGGEMQSLPTDDRDHFEMDSGFLIGPILDEPSFPST